MAVRPYRSNDHLWSTAGVNGAGVVAVLPLRADDIHFDAAWSNSYPVDGDEGEHGSTVLNIGRSVEVRATGNAYLLDGAWTLSHLSDSRRGSRADLTPTMRERLRSLLAEAISAWALTHEGDIAQADDIYRNNGARTIEENIARHEAALSILRAELSACEEGEPFTQYPDLPTKGR